MRAEMEMEKWRNCISAWSQRWFCGSLSGSGTQPHAHSRRRPPPCCSGYPIPTPTPPRITAQSNLARGYPRIEPADQLVKTTGESVTSLRSVQSVLTTEGPWGCVHGTSPLWSSLSSSSRSFYTSHLSILKPFNPKTLNFGMGGGSEGAGNLLLVGRTGRLGRRLRFRAGVISSEPQEVPR